MAQFEILNDAGQVVNVVVASAAFVDQHYPGRYRELAEPAPTVDWPSLIAARRYQAETAGFTWNGYFIATDRESQAKIDTEDRAIDRGLRVDGAGWKCLDLATSQIVFRATTNAEMHDLAASAYRYVRACFDREAALLGELDAGTFTADMLEQGWP